MSLAKLKMVVSAVLILLMVIIVDNVSKSFVRNSIPYGEKIPVSKGVVFTHITNKGFFMNFGENLVDEYRYWMVSIIPLIAMLWFTYKIWVKFPLEYLTAVGIALLLGGGLGNLSDRILAGGVTDFMYIELDSFKSSIFNIADLSIFFGLIVLIIQRLKMAFDINVGSSGELIGRGIEEDKSRFRA